MSLLQFPPLYGKQHPFALHEVNGRIAYGSAEEVDVLSKSDLLADYPKIDKKQLEALQHSISRENVGRVFSETQMNRFQQAVNVWQRNGSRGLLEFVVNISEGTRFAWPLASAGRLLWRAEEGLRSALTLSEESIHELVMDASTNLSWRTNWVRCVAFHDDGCRMAVCQLTDHIRIYSFGAVKRAPITLKHIRQRNVTQMAWKPFDIMVLAVACEDAVIIWRLNPKALTSRPSAQCAQVLEVSTSFTPITQCIWDYSLSSAIFVVSPSSSRLVVMDTATGESDSVDSWMEAPIYRVWSSADYDKLLVSYYSDTIRVYDRSCWREEKWTGLAGGCVAAVWSPNGTYLLFITRNEPSICSIRFTNHIELNQDGQQILRSYGTETPIMAYNLCELNYQNDKRGGSCTVGGCVHDMQLSPDGKRLAVAFKKNPSVIALFISDWSPSVLLTPCALIEGASFGNSAIISFCPKFKKGSLLCVVWTAGRLQYIPLIYGRSADVYIDSSLFISASDKLSSSEASFERRLPQQEGVTKKSHEFHISLFGDDGSDKELQLFSTCALYDQLILKCT